MNNVDAVRWEGTGAASELTVHGGKLPASAPTDAGPTRASTTTYTFHSSRYLVDEGLMTRAGGVYRFTASGESVWRVERYIRERYLVASAA